MRLQLKAQLSRPSGFSLELDLDCTTSALGIVGPSGSGKSTLLACIAGIEPGATVIIDGVEYTQVPVHRRGMGYVTQDALLFPHLSVKENLGYSPRATDIQACADALGIGHLLDRMPANLSGGERRRVALGRALLSQPRLLLLDEPFGGLDERRRQEAAELVRSVHQRHGIPIVLVSHLEHEVASLCEHVLTLDNGRVVDAPV